MMDAPKAPSSWADGLVARCAELGVAAWQSSAVGEASPLHAPSACAAWLDSPVLHTLVVRQIDRWLSEGAGEPVELLPGGWLLPVHASGLSGRPTLVAALVCATIEPGSTELEAICESADVTVGAAAASLEQLRSQAWQDVGQIGTVLRWSVEELCRRDSDAIVVHEFSEKLIQSYEETNLLYRLGRLLNCSTSASSTVETTCRQISEILAFNWVAAKFRPVGVLPDLADRFVVAGTLPCDEAALLAQVEHMMLQWTSDDWTRVLLPDSSELAALVGAEVVCERLTHDGQVIGALLAGNKQGSDPEVSSVETQFLDATADFLGVFHENAARFAEQRSLFFGTLKALTASIDAKDRYTLGHSERVSLMACQLASVCRMDDHEIEQIRIAGLVHDVGKIGVPESVLCKPGRLTEEEFAQMRLHPVIGHQILKDIPPMAPALPGVLYHHERWDGKGYPEGLAGDRIPLYGRMLACADAFDAMSSTRSYRPAMDRQHVLAEFDRCAGSQFDPELAHAFVSLDFEEYDDMVAWHQDRGGRAA